MVHQAEPLYLARLNITGMSPRLASNTTLGLTILEIVTGVDHLNKSLAETYCPSELLNLR